MSCSGWNGFNHCHLGYIMIEHVLNDEGFINYEHRFVFKKNMVAIELSWMYT